MLLMASVAVLCMTNARAGEDLPPIQPIPKPVPVATNDPAPAPAPAPQPTPETPAEPPAKRPRAVRKKAEPETGGPPPDLEGMVALVYETYCEGVGGIAYNGDKLPDWETFAKDPAKEKQANAWRAAVAAAWKPAATEPPQPAESWQDLRDRISRAVDDLEADPGPDMTRPNAAWQLRQALPALAPLK